MLLRRATLIAALLLVTTAAHAADSPPPFVYLLELIGPGKNDYQLGSADLATKKFSIRYEKLPYGFQLAVHAATRRFALTFGVDDDAVVPTLDGKTAAVPVHNAAIFLGDLDHGVTTVLAGEKACVAAKCFEVAARFSPDGTRVYTRLLYTMYTVMRAYALGGEAPFGWTAIDKHKAKKGVGDDFSFSPDGTRVAYQAADGYYVETLPAPPKDAKTKPTALKQSKRIAPLTLQVNDYPLLLTEKELVYFGREKKEQREGYIEVLDLASKKVVRVFTFPYDYPEWHDAFQYSLARRTVVFRTGDDTVPGPMWALTLDDAKVTKLLDGVDHVFDVSPDGRYVLVGLAPVDEKDTPGWSGSNVFLFAVVDLSTGKVIASAPLPAAAGYSSYAHPQAFFFTPAN